MADRLRENYAKIRERIDHALIRTGRTVGDATLVAVTKQVDFSVVQRLYELGHRDFGENRPQALAEKADQLPNDIRWHMIGSWQTNKIRKILPHLHLAHSIDRLALAEAVSAESIRQSRPALPVLLEINVSQEETKHGFSIDAVREVFSSLASLPGISVRGLMTMARFEADPEQCRATFRQLRELREALQRQSSWELPFLSMGMSNDFEVALEEGANLVRVGSALFEGVVA